MNVSCAEYCKSVQLCRSHPVIVPPNDDEEGRYRSASPFGGYTSTRDC